MVVAPSVGGGAHTLSPQFNVLKREILIALIVLYVPSSQDMFEDTQYSDILTSVMKWKTEWYRVIVSYLLRCMFHNLEHRFISLF